MKITNEQLLEKFTNMKPMKYQEPDFKKQQAKDMLNNKNNDFIAMRKYDGEWCRAIIHKDGVLLQSRSVSTVTKTYGNKTELVPHITEELQSIWPVGTVLLGELAFDDYTSTSREVGSILRCKPPKAIMRQKENKIHFFIFDVLAFNFEDLTDLPFEKRINYSYKYTNGKYFHQVQRNTNKPFIEMAEDIWDKGGEGLVIIRKDMIYAPGKRPAWKSAKVKKKLGTLYAKVIGFIDPNKEYEGDELSNWKYFVDKNNKPVDILKGIKYDGLIAVTKPFYYGWKNGIIVEYKGRTVKVSSGLNDEIREWLATKEAKTLLEEGKLDAEITGMLLTEDSIRHPVFLKIIKPLK